MTKRIPRLFVLPPSHYCERARWALDHMKIAYVEEPWAVGLHVAFARRLAPRSTLPILDTGTAILQGSDRILEWTGIAGGDATLEHRFERRVGVLVRQYIYAATLADPRSAVRDTLLSGVPPAQAFIARLAWPVTRRAMASGMDARIALLPELEEKIEAELAWFESILRRGKHIVGAELGRADVTAASLLAPLARPAACPLYRKVVLPPEAEAALTRWSARPALQWVDRIYGQYRRPAQ